MNFFTFLMIVSVCAMVFVIALRGMSHEERKQRYRQSSGGSADMQRELANLEERVRTLEAIVTDPRQQVAHQISELERRSA